MISLNNVFYKYENGMEALKNININIKEGESVAFVGVNGSGKSTLMKLINGLMFPTEGNYLFRNEEITLKKMKNGIFSKGIHKDIGFIFQNSEVQLFCSNVYDEIAFGPRQMGMLEEDVEKRVKDMLELLDINELRNRHPYHLSGGEKKKVAIAAVLVLNPQVIILDEPMNGLDPKSKRFIRELMINLNFSGKTIICSTHDFPYVEGVFKRAVVFSSDHSIIRDGDYDEILQDTEFLIQNNII